MALFILIWGSKLNSVAFEVAGKHCCRFRGGTLIKVKFVNTPVFVAALFRWQIETPRSAVGQHDKGNARVKGVFECLAHCILGFAGVGSLQPTTPRANAAVNNNAQIFRMSSPSK